MQTAADARTASQSGSITYIDSLINSAINNGDFLIQIDGNKITSETLRTFRDLGYTIRTKYSMGNTDFPIYIIEWDITVPVPPSTDEIIITYDDILNVPVADAYSVSDWNSLFQLPEYGNPFTSVIINANDIHLIGGSNITLKSGLFENDLHILQFGDTTDNNIIVSALDTCFNGCHNIISIELFSCTGIGNQCMQACSSLGTLSIPKLESAGEYAISECHALSNITFDNLISAGNGCFGWGYGLTSVTLPKLTYLGEHAFMACSFLTDIHLPLITSLDTFTFNSCGALTFADIPNLVTAGDYCFNQCITLDTDFLNLVTAGVGTFTACFSTSLGINFPSLTYIGNNCFDGCVNLPVLHIPNLLYAGEYAFYNMTSLISMDLPELISLGAYGFYYCTSLTSVNIPKVTELNAVTFNLCTSLTDITAPLVISIGVSCFESCTSLVNLSLPQLLTAFDYCFGSCTSLDNPYLPLLNDLCEGAFYDCNSLTTIDLPSLWILRGTYTFAKCYALSTINLPLTTTLGDSADYDAIFNEIIGNVINVTINPVIMSCNAGNPDGDMQNLGSNNIVTVNGESYPIPFITTWKTDNPGTSASDSITIPLNGTYYYNFFIEWGDGTSEVATGYLLELTHQYLGGAGTYTVSIKGVFPSIYFNGGGDCLKILSIEQWGDVVWESFYEAFDSCENLVINATDEATAKTGTVTVWNTSFANCSSLTTFPLLDTSSATDINDAWAYCTGLTSFPLLDTSSVTRFSGCWNGCTSIVDFPELNFDAMTDGSGCFSGVTIPTDTYTNIIKSLALNNPNNSVTFNGGLSTYDYTAIASHDTLTNAPKSWTITDGGISVVGAFLTEWTVAGDATARTITLPLVDQRAEGALAYNCTVIWGDGSFSTVTAYNDVNRVHTYALDGTYQVAITGTCEGWSINYGADRTKLTKVVDWGTVGTFNGFKYLKQGFFGCTNLTTLPSVGGILASGTGVLTDGFYYLFGDCTALSSISPDLFRYNSAISTNGFYQTFYNCISLASLPSDLFRYTTQVSASGFRQTFQNCDHLTSLPSDFFTYTTAVSTDGFLNTFYSCTSLASVPTDLFRYNTACTSFFQTFKDCDKLEINASIFCDEATEMTTRFNDQSVNFTNCFKRTSFTGTQGTAPQLWNYTYGSGTPTKTTCYGGGGNSLTSLDNYASIDAPWL